MFCETVSRFDLLVVHVMILLRTTMSLDHGCVKR